jgi:hypothetical protein
MRFGNAARIFNFQWHLTSIFFYVFQIFRTTWAILAIWSAYLVNFLSVDGFICFWKLKIRVALPNRVRSVNSCLITEHSYGERVSLGAHLNPPCKLSPWEETAVSGENQRLSEERWLNLFTSVLRVHGENLTHDLRGERRMLWRLRHRSPWRLRHRTVTLWENFQHDFLHCRNHDSDPPLYLLSCRANNESTFTVDFDSVRNLTLS